MAVETLRLQEALRKWRSGSPAPLLDALGFEQLGMQVPSAALADFGLDPAEPLKLEIAARNSGFHVFRIAFNTRLEPDAIRRAAGALYRHNPTRRALLIFEARDDARLVFASWGLGPGPFRLSKLWIDLAAPRRSDLDILAGLAVNGACTPSELALAHARALDRERVTRRFFAEFRRRRAELAAAIKGVPLGAEQDRLDLALLLLSRLLFLYFIQRKGWLAGDPAYIPHLFEASCRDGIPFYRRRLKHLFFGALDRPPERRGRRARELGELPYLNGGLFERVPLERKHPRIDIPDDGFAPILHDLLDKYQFTLREDQPADQDVAVHPEMLGKVFEGLMAGPMRGSTGAFYTPRALVDRLVDGALSAHLSRAAGVDPETIDRLLQGGPAELQPQLRRRLADRVREIRVLDPAAGSGAFLLAALQTLERLRDALEGRPSDPFALFQRRQQIIRQNLHGVDINGAAVRLCELRLWLALVVDLEVESVADVPPLPNLDINIRQGDALVDPLDFLSQMGHLDDRNLAGRWRRAVTRLAARKDRYFRSAGASKRGVGRTLRKAERDLAVSFMGELAAQIDARREDLRAAARSRDLFGRRAGLSRSQRRAALALERRNAEIGRLLRRMRDLEELPFFSFPIHFADPDRPGRARSFHVVLGNPPWVRTHHWTGMSRNRLKQRFQFLRDAGWKAGGRLAGAGRGFGAQLDLSALFLERSLELLSDDGALGFLLPAKLARGLSAGALRHRLLQTTRLLSLEDCSLAPTRLFEATTYPLAILLAQGAPDLAHTVRLRVHGRGGRPLDFTLAQARIPLIADDPESPWTLAPPPVRDALDRMRAAGPPLGAHPGRRPRRGIVTGGNAVFVGEVLQEPTVNGLVPMSLGGSEVRIEAERLRPVLRGEDLASWRFSVDRALIWTHDDNGDVLPTLPPATKAHMQKHERWLKARRDLRPGQLPWTLFRVRPDKWARRVAWRDIAPAPGAVAVPARVPFMTGPAPLLSLNTVYQIPVGSDDEAHLLAATLNSTVAHAFLKAIAERASGGHFRFLGWTVALLPFPLEVDEDIRVRCIEMSERAHADGRLAPDEQRELDDLVGRLYGLPPDDVRALRSFDASLLSPAASL